MNQSQIFGIIRHALTFGAGYIAAKGWVNAGDVPQIVSAAMTLAGVLWSIYEKIEQKPAGGAGPGLPSGAAMAAVALGLISFALFNGGCASTGAGGNATAAIFPQTPAARAAVVAQIVQDGTQLGVGAALLQKPELRPYFEASREALNALLAAQTTDPVQLQADLNQSVPAVEQPLVDAALEAAIGTYATWYNANAAQLTASDTTKYALQILTALDTGLNAALGSNTVSAQPVAL